MTEAIVDRLLRSEEPSVRYKVLVNVLGEDESAAKIKQLREKIKGCSRVKLLLSERRADGTTPYHPYQKWRGAHWILATLADLGYPSGDESLRPMLERSYKWLLSERHAESIRTIEGRVRRCGSQESNCVYYSLALGLADERTDELAQRLIKWQWPDGGWNCDKRPEAVNSSYHESIIPLRALSLYARLKGNEEAKEAADRAAELFLKRRLYKRQKDGKVMSKSFVDLFYPPYWHYGILIGLKVMAESGYIGDERCSDALDLLESKQLPDGGFPAERRYYETATPAKPSGRELVDWGGVSKTRSNEFVTADALFILRAAGRLQL
ncbi:MAG: hypothetical protein JW759_00170 [Candidatus Coatesbacteria bacterium]|nr:hypothetical protein [Candidatus Coatesbacteria bacterium]